MQRAIEGIAKIKPMKDKGRLKIGLSAGCLDNVLAGASPFKANEMPCRHRSSQGERRLHFI